MQAVKKAQHLIKSPDTGRHAEADALSEAGLLTASRSCLVPGISVSLSHSIMTFECMGWLSLD